MMDRTRPLDPEDLRFGDPLYTANLLLEDLDDELDRLLLKLEDDDD